MARPWFKANRVLALAVFVALGACAPAMAGAERFAGVARWLLLLNDPLADSTVAEIARSDYDMAVVDFAASYSWNAGVSMDATIAALKRRANGAPRLVIAYLNVGQAEDYRGYWREEWHRAPPGWILGADPEGWAGNFPVAYWHPEWRAIIAGAGGLAERIARAGFDGAYLDWVAGYWDERVAARAAADGVDARRAMVGLLSALAARARAVNPDFRLIVQNAADLAADPAMAGIADAFVQEHIWFDGAEGNAPQGDCPMPQKSDEAGSPGYLARLPEACRAAHAAGRAGTLDYALAEEVLPLLDDARARGFAVFTVDYAAAPDNVAAAVAASRTRGFVPFVGARALDRYVPPQF